MVETQVPFSSRPFTLRRFLPSLTSSSYASFSSHRTLFYVLWIAAFASLFVWQRNSLAGFSIFGGYRQVQSGGSTEFPRLRGWVFNVTEFGAVGDGVTVNTEAFERAVARIARVGKRGGGGQLNVPRGKWLTGPFNLTSYMTLFLAEGAVILGIQPCDGKKA